MATRTVGRLHRTFLIRMTRTIRVLEPSARVVLYGSQARGDAQPDSDWDLLIVIEGAATPERKAALRRQLYDLGVQTDSVLSPVIQGRDEWESPLSRASPFRGNVEREGIEL